MAKEITLTRIFEAPIDKVWLAWTDPKQFAKWFGAPGQVDLSSAAADLKEGGEWKATTVDTDGAKFPFVGKYRQIVQPTRLVFTFENVADRNDPKVEVVTIILSDLGGKTEMIFKQAGNLPDKEYETGLKQGWTGFFDKLAEILK